MAKAGDAAYVKSELDGLARLNQGTLERAGDPDVVDAGGVVVGDAGFGP